MAQITRGVVSVTNGSAVVTGDAAALFSTGSPAVAVSDLFKVNGETTYYSVLSVDSDTQITLTSNYGGATNTGLNYTITKDFYVNTNMIRINAGDAELAEILDRNFLLLDTALLNISVDAGLTASATQSQGNGALSSGINEISVVVNEDDTVTLPVASIGLRVVVINNGAKTLQIFPASGNNLGSGINNPTYLPSGDNVQYVAYNNINWEAI